MYVLCKRTTEREERHCSFLFTFIRVICIVMYSRRTAFKENRTFLNKMYEKKRLVRKKWMAAASDVRRTIYILHKEEHMKT